MVDYVSVKAHNRSYPKGVKKQVKKRFSGRDVMAVCRTLEKKYPVGIPVSVLKSKVSKARKVSNSEVEDMILFLKRDGLLFSPSKGKVRLVR